MNDNVIVIISISLGLVLVFIVLSTILKFFGELMEQLNPVFTKLLIIAGVVGCVYFIMYPHEARELVNKVRQGPTQTTQPVWINQTY